MTDDIPLRMQKRPRDHRGFPIPFAQFVGKDGKADFRVLDDEKVNRCLRLRLCGLCGEPMGRHVFFVGGPACVPNALFCDPPMHKDCAEFALRICAHLNRSKGKHRLGNHPTEPGVEFTESAIASTEKADWFALMHTIDYTFARNPADKMLYIKAKLPWLEIVRWRDGAPIKESADAL